MLAAFYTRQGPADRSVPSPGPTPTLGGMLRRTGTIASARYALTDGPHPTFDRR